jgi:hypothetical protein
MLQIRQKAVEDLEGAKSRDRRSWTLYNVVMVTILDVLTDYHVCRTGN